MADVLRVNGHAFAYDDLSYDEMRQVRRIVRNELWDEDLDGEFDWGKVGDTEIVPATIFVFMRREDPSYTLEQALACKDRDVLTDDDEVPPTKPASRRSARTKTSAANGTRS